MGKEDNEVALRLNLRQQPFCQLNGVFLQVTLVSEHVLRLCRSLSKEYVHESDFHAAGLDYHVVLSHGLPLRAVHDVGRQGMHLRASHHFLVEIEAEFQLLLTYRENVIAHLVHQLANELCLYLVCLNLRRRKISPVNDNQVFVVASLLSYYPDSPSQAALLVAVSPAGGQFAIRVAGEENNNLYILNSLL